MGQGFALLQDLSSSHCTLETLCAGKLLIPVSDFVLYLQFTRASKSLVTIGPGIKGFSSVRALCIFFLYKKTKQKTINLLSIDQGRLFYAKPKGDKHSRCTINFFTLATQTE